LTAIFDERPGITAATSAPAYVHTAIKVPMIVV
jgi:hypothetical protein